MHPNILTQDDLKAATGCSRLNDLEDNLRKNGVRFLYGKKGIYTTMAALNAAMGLESEQQINKPDDEIKIL